MPCDHGHVLAIAHLATPEVVEQAIENALAAKQAWSELPWSEARRHLYAQPNFFVPRGDNV